MLPQLNPDRFLGQRIRIPHKNRHGRCTYLFILNACLTLVTCRSTRNCSKGRIGHKAEAILNLDLLPKDQFSAQTPARANPLLHPIRRCSAPGQGGDNQQQQRKRGVGEAETDMFGDIPYSEALKGQECLQPKLDAQKDIYADLLVTLDKAIGNLETAVSEKLNNVKDQDLVFGGDMNQWLASAYGLKARYLIHQTAVDKSVLASAASAAQKAIDLGFTGMKIKEFNGVTCDNPWSAFIWSRSYIASSARVAKMMEATGDPRLNAYTANGQATLVEPGDAEAAKVMDGSLGYPTWYDLGSQPIHLLSQSEIYFILAEAQLRQGQDATEAFQAAVTSAVTDILTIIGEDASGAGDFAASLGKPTLKLLFEQKYLAQCVDEQVETYNDIRRCEAMGERHITLTNPYNTQGGMNRVPKRLPYGNDSVLNNPTIAEAYGDGFYVYDQPVWWAGGSR